MLHGDVPAQDDVLGQMAYGLLAISEGMMLVNESDQAIIDSSLGIYDALYANFRAHELVRSSGRSIPAPDAKGPTRPTLFLRELLKAGAARD